MLSIKSLDVVYSLLELAAAHTILTEFILHFLEGSFGFLIRQRFFLERA